MALRDLLRNSGWTRRVDNESMTVVGNFHDENWGESAELDVEALEMNSIVFVDGVSRILCTIGSGPFKILVAQIVVGAMELTIGSEPSPVSEPESVVYMVVPEEIGEAHGISDGEILNLGDLEIEALVSRTPDLIDAVGNAMSFLEMRLSKSIAEDPGFDGVVIKDGSLKPIYEATVEPTFVPGRGPVGLVKNVEDISALMRISIPIEEMDRGYTSRAFVKEFKGGHKLVSVFLKLTSRGMPGLVRLDAVVVSEGEVPNVLRVFKGLSGILPDLTPDVVMGRYPENLPTISSLETHLRAYLYDPRYVEYEISGYIGSI